MTKLWFLRHFFSLSFPSFVKVVLFKSLSLEYFGFFLFPLQCKTDGTFRSQVEGYPKLFEQGNQQMLLFRGPRFNRTITFDPVMELTEDDDGDGNGNGDGDGDGDGDGNGDNENHASTMCINVFMFVAVLGTMFL